MRCISCNRMLTDTERLSVKYAIDEENPDVLIKTDEPEDMCFRCRGKAAEQYSILDREYAFEDLTSGITKPAGFSDNY